MDLPTIWPRLRGPVNSSSYREFLKSRDVKMNTPSIPFSWVGRQQSDRPAAGRAGRYSRPLSGRDKIVSAAFGNEVRRLRLKSGWSTRQLADLVGMSQPSIVYIEQHRANVELRLIWDFAEALGIEAAQFVAVCDRAITLATIQKLESQNGTLPCNPSR